jgi:ribonuclease P protein 3
LNRRNKGTQENTFKNEIHLTTFSPLQLTLFKHPRHSFSRGTSASSVYSASQMAHNYTKFRLIFNRNLSSVYKPRNKIRLKNESLENVLLTATSEINWATIRSELIASERSVNLTNVDGIIIGLCSRECRLDIAKSYVNFMNKQSLSINDASIGKLLRLFYFNHVHQQAAISSGDEEEILRFCNALIEKHPIMNDILVENVIHGLCLTRDWMRSLKVLEKFKATGSSPNVASFSCIIAKALAEQELEIAGNLVDQIAQSQMMLRPSVLADFIRKVKDDKKKVEKLLTTMQENSWMLPESSIGEFRSIFGDKCRIVEMNRNGKCRSCSHQLSSIKLNADEFAKLSRTFLDDVLIRKDVFLKSSDEELERFKKFIDKTGPFGCVIDGLNVAYSHGTQQGPKMFAKNVRKSEALRRNLTAVFCRSQWQ